MLKVKSFRIEYATHPIGLDERRPRFSWALESDNRNVLQTSYRIKVLNIHDECVWDSGEIQSERSQFVVYEGAPLKPRERYEATLIVSDNKFDMAIGGLIFETGLMGGKLKGNFIGAPFDDVLPVFKKAFLLEKHVARARIYATALGVYELYLNGKRVGDAYDAPGWTSYSHCLQYQTYDVTNLLHKENEISALVAPGWYAGTVGYFHRKNCYGKKTAVCLDLYIDYIDGSTQIISTDTDWRAEESSVRKSDFQDGEICDTTFCAKKSYVPEKVDYDKNNIIAQICEPMRIVEKLPVKALIKTPKGETVLDFGQNASGVVEFTVKGKKGNTVVLHHAEVLDKEGNFYTENLRGVKAEDCWVLNGETQTLRPHFTAHGFRYVRLTGFDGEIDTNDFYVCVIHTDMPVTGTFTCENELVKRLRSNIVWGQRGNFMDVPTDCPQRDERLGWTADAQLFCRTAAYNYNVAPFFKKWLNDLKSEQTKELGVPHTVPNVIPGNEVGAGVWGDAATIVPWTLYEIYGDLRILEDQYESMKDWVEYIRGQAPEYLWQTGFQFGDWLALDKEAFSDRTGATDKYFIASAFYANSVQLVAKSAALLGKDKDARNYGELYEKIINAFRREYFTSTGRMVTETQTGCVLALAFGLVPEEFKERLCRTLRENLEDHDTHLTTGFVGTPYICHVLTENGMQDLAEKLLLNEDFPGWLYEVRMGATTLWERWNGIMPDGELFDPAMNSFNHYAYGAVGDWLYRKVAGIVPAEAGYKKIRIKPYPIAELGNVRATFESGYGKVGAEYLYEKNIIRFRILIPVNTQADIELPDGKTVHTGSGLYEYKIRRSTLSGGKKGKNLYMRDIFANEACNAFVRSVLSEGDYAMIRSYYAHRTFQKVMEKLPALQNVENEIYNKML